MVRPRHRRLEIEALEDRFAPSITTLASGLNYPLGVAVDGNGNVYIADSSNNAVKEWVKATGIVNTLVSTGLRNPDGVAVDGSGNVYIADTGNSAIEKWNSSSNTLTTLVPSTAGLFVPTGVAVDESGNIYIADNGNSAIKEWAASSNTLTTLVSSGLGRPTGVAVDGSGNVYIADYGNSAIKEWVASSSTLTTLVASGSGLSSPFGVAVDGRGNVYIGDSGNNALKEWAASSSTVITLVSSGLSFPAGVAVDGSGNVYIADYGNNAIKEFVPPPSISSQPQNTSATVGQTGPATFTVSATGSALSYQWQISTDNGVSFTDLNNGTGVTGATTSSLALSGFSTTGSAEYDVVITDGTGASVTSNAANFTINAAPAITTQPTNATATSGQSGPESFVIAASGGTGALTVQWEISTTDGASFSSLSNGNGIAGASSTTLTLSGLGVTGAAVYRAVVTDANGVTATSNPATLTVNARPSIETQPGDASATTGQVGPESFSVTAADGTGPFTYEWQVSTDGGGTFTNVSNGSGISGATTATLTIGSTALPASTSEYKVVVTDANGVTATSAAATLTINAPPSISTQPQDAIATVGQSVTESFTIGVSGGTAPFAVQWQISTDNGGSFSNLSNSSSVAGATTTTLLVGGFDRAGSAEYRALVTDANGVMATSNPANLIVNAAASFTTQPQNGTATVGQSAPVSFSIAASGGTVPLAVQWQISTDNGTTFTNLSDGNGVSGSAASTLTLSGFLSVGSAEYLAIVTDANGVATKSNAATLAVSPSSADPNQNWLTQVYADLFHRALDASGLATWSALLKQGASRTQVALLIEASLEYRSDIIEALYTRLLDRPADATGLNAFATFLGKGGTTSQVEAAILGSTEYFQLHGGTNDNFLNAIYQAVLNRAPDASGAQSWASALAGGSTRAAIAQAILASLESDTNEVRSLFNEFLHRVADSSGLNSFTTALHQGEAAEGAIAGIVGSNEYFARTQ
jgi:sugar lactone lactonase YvrE